MTQKTRKPNGYGHTYKNGNSYRTVIQHHGKTITASARTAQESRRIAKEKVKTLPLGPNGQLLETSKLTLEDFLMHWLEVEHKQAIAFSTYSRYISLAKHHINPNLGKVLIQELTPRQITWFLNQMKQKGQSPRSQQQARALLSIALKAAEELELISLNPVRKVRNPQNKSKPISPLTISEVKRLLAFYDSTYMSARLHIALLCGLRQGEALGLRWNDVDLLRGNLFIRYQVQKIEGVYKFTHLKTDRSQRQVAIGSETTQVLVAHKKIVTEMKNLAGIAWQESDLVFPNKNGGFRSPVIDYHDWRRALKQCSVSPRRLHDARHTAATLMYSQSIGIETISRALGHSSSAITSRLYVHSAEEPLRIAAEKLNALISNDSHHCEIA
jgi:integrase